jgi:hypothetical protein
MTTQSIQVLDPDTGMVIGVCRGPTPSGRCPLAGRNGVVPCAGRLISPPDADDRFWPLSVPRNHRHCEFGWNARAVADLEEAEACRAKWRAGAARETKRVFARAAAGDPRYRRMTTRQLESTGLWRWRLSTSAIQLSRSEEKHEKRARMYLNFAEYRRLTAAPEQPAVRHLPA